MLSDITIDPYINLSRDLVNHYKACHQSTFTIHNNPDDNFTVANVWILELL